MVALEEQNRLVAKFGLDREWAEYKEKMGDEAEVYGFLARHKIILPLEDMKDYYLPDNFLEEIKVIDQTPYGIFLNIGAIITSSRLYMEQLIPFRIPFSAA